MRKYVYLFELDSVRKTDADIIAGQKALYDEIVLNGNIVVLTYNQLVDSRGFFSLLRDPAYSRGLVKLFKRGAIRLSQFGDTRTVSQYLLNSIEDDKKFIYSALPLRYSQKRLTALMRRCLTYSDLSEIHDYMELADRGDEEGWEKVESLFVEMVNGTEHATTLSKEQMQMVLENLYSLLAIVLRISTLHDIYICPRDPKEYQNLKLWNILNAVLKFDAGQDQTLFAEAAELIRGLDAFREQNQNRSVYIRQIHDAADKVQASCRQYAQAVVDLCYNYACENSICNISKHYNVDELLEECAQKPTFQADFFSRMQQYWQDGNDGDARFPLEETNEFIPFAGREQIPDIQEAVRLVDYLDYKEPDEPETIARYEYGVDRQQKMQQKSIMSAIAQKMFFALLCIVIACFVEFAFNWMQDQFDTYFVFNSFVETILMLFLTEAITTVLSNWFPSVLTLSDAVGGIGRLIGDAWQILGKKSSAYKSNCTDGVDAKEVYSKGHPIEYVRSNALKKYAAWKNRQVAQQNDAVADSPVYPMVDVNDPNVAERLVRMEELYHYHFGMVYESRFNRMVVDPILAEDGGIFPYERVLPANDDGVVILTRYKGRFVLLRQFRHALRRDQYAFPRGYADPGCSNEENVSRELMEELGAKIVGKPVELGRITPDSGLTSGCVYVYLAEIDHYEEKVGYEGIEQVVALSEEEFVSWIRNGKIDDGYTMGAYLLGQQKIPGYTINEISEDKK